MELLIAIVLGILFAGGIFCILRRSLIKIAIGVMLISQGANLLVFASGGLVEKIPAFALSETGFAPEGYADPIPQALVLTAIVIGFGLIVFTLSLLLKAHAAIGSDDINAFNETDKLT